jgi:lipopolysaccharide biosynthesis glycosyltransferase
MIQKKIKEQFPRMNEKEAYFNSGVLVFDIKRSLEEKLSEKFLAAIPFLLETVGKECFTEDQDVINYVCVDNVKIIGHEWNVFQEPSACKNANIIHYAWKDKPWSADLYQKDIWWYYALKTPFYWRVIVKNFSHFVILFAKLVRWQIKNLCKSICTT